MEYKPTVPKPMKEDIMMLSVLRTTTVATAEDVAKVAGIDLTDKEFWRGALQTVAQQIDLVCGLLEEGKQ